MKFTKKLLSTLLFLSFSNVKPMDGMDLDAFDKVTEEQAKQATKKADKFAEKLVTSAKEHLNTVKTNIKKFTKKTLGENITPSATNTAANAIEAATEQTKTSIKKSPESLFSKTKTSFLKAASATKNKIVNTGNSGKAFACKHKYKICGTIAVTAAAAVVYIAYKKYKTDKEQNKVVVPL